MSQQDVRSAPERALAPVALVDLLDRVLGTGVVLSGDLVISLAGVDLVQVRLHALIASVRKEMWANAGETALDTTALQSSATQRSGTQNSGLASSATESAAAHSRAVDSKSTGTTSTASSSTGTSSTRSRRAGGGRRDSSPSAEDTADE